MCSCLSHHGVSFQAVSRLLFELYHASDFIMRERRIKKVPRSILRGYTGGMKA